MVFLLVDGETEIMRIDMFASSRWNTTASEGYEELAEQNSVIYAVKKGDYQGELQINLEDIRQAFMLLDGQ